MFRAGDGARRQEVTNAITQLQAQGRVRAVRTRRQYLRVGSTAPSVAPTVLRTPRPPDRSPRWATVLITVQDDALRLA